MNPARIWDELLGKTDREVIHRGGYGARRGVGRRPALLVIDAQYNYFGRDLPILEQIEAWPSGVGRAAWNSVPRVAELLGAFRSGGAPVIYTRQIRLGPGLDAFHRKAPNRASEPYLDGAKGTRIIEELKPGPDDLVIDKSHASAFFGTPLHAFMTRLKIDTLFILGGTTSGCVRSSAVEATARGFDTVVVWDCVFDRIEFSHKAALLDLWMKYCDLMDSGQVLDYVSLL